MPNTLTTSRKQEVVLQRLPALMTLLPALAFTHPPFFGMTSYISFGPAKLAMELWRERAKTY